MSRAGVGMVIDELVTDENLRFRFALSPVDALAELLGRGFDLSAEEIDLFCGTDVALWFLGDAVRNASLRSTATCGCAAG